MSVTVVQQLSEPPLDAHNSKRQGNPSHPRETLPRTTEDRSKSSFISRYSKITPGSTTPKTRRGLWVPRLVPVGLCRVVHGVVRRPSPSTICSTALRAPTTQAARHHGGGEPNSPSLSARQRHLQHFGRPPRTGTPVHQGGAFLVSSLRVSLFLTRHFSLLACIDRCRQLGMRLAMPTEGRVISCVAVEETRRCQAGLQREETYYCTARKVSVRPCLSTFSTPQWSMLNLSS